MSSGVVTESRTVAHGARGISTLQWDYTGIWTDAGTYTWADSATEQASLAFVGTGMDIYANRGPAQGIAEILVDGTSQGTFNLYDSVSSTDVLLTSVTGLANGQHTVVVVVTGNQDVSATDDRVELTRAVVASSAPRTTGITVTPNSAATGANVAATATITSPMDVTLDSVVIATRRVGEDYLDTSPGDFVVATNVFIPAGGSYIIPESTRTFAASDELYTYVAWDIGGARNRDVQKTASLSVTGATLLFADDMSGTSSTTYADDSTNGGLDKSFFIENGGYNLIRENGYLRNSARDNYRIWLRENFGGAGQNLRIKYKLECTDLGANTTGIVSGVKTMFKFVAPIHDYGVHDPRGCLGRYAPSDPWLNVNGVDQSPGAMYYVPIGADGKHGMSKRLWGSDDYLFSLGSTETVRAINVIYDVEVHVEWIADPKSVRITSFIDLKDGLGLVQDHQWTNTATTSSLSSEGFNNGDPYDWPCFIGMRCDDAFMRWHDLRVETL